MRVRPCVLLPDNEKILLLHYKYGNEDVYGIPGGSADPGETLTDAIVREVKEELSIPIQVEKLLFVGEILYPHPKESVLNCIFLGKLLSLNPSVNPQDTSALGFVWASMADLQQINLYPNIGEQITAAWKSGFMNPPSYIGKIQQNWF